MKTRYIHYGQSRFDKSKVGIIQNEDYARVKPKQSSGMWASPVNAGYGWEQWCKDNDFYIERLKESFTFTLKADARVYHIKSVKDLEKLPEHKIVFSSTWYCIDFEEASKNYDAIQLHLSDEIVDKNYPGLYYALYGWDCDSILIMNPDIVVVDH